METIKKDQSEIKNAISEINNILKGINSRLGEAEDQMNFKKWEELKKHWMTEGNNICIMGMPGGEESEQGIENLFEEIMTETSLIQWREKTHIPGNSVNPKQVGPKDPTPRHIVIKMIRLKDKERILTAAREKQGVTYKGAPMRLSSDSLTETCQAKREGCEIFKVIKSKDLQLRLLYWARLSFKIEGEIRSFPDKKKLKEFVNTKPVLQQMLKGLL